MREINNYRIGQQRMNIFDRWNIDIVKYDIIIESLPSFFSGLRILHVTDLHGKWFGKDQIGIVDALKGLKFDMIAVTGDLVNKHDPALAAAIVMFEELKKYGVPIFFVSGNHEWYSGYKMRSYLDNGEIVVLSNRSVRVQKGGFTFNIIGVDDPHTNRDDMQRAMRSVKSEYPKILLAHAPEIVFRKEFEKINAALCGHTHGGQFRLPFIGAVYVPGQFLFPKLVKGHYRIGKSDLLICGGLGESRINMRLFNRPEIYLINVRGV